MLVLHNLISQQLAPGDYRASQGGGEKRVQCKPSTVHMKVQQYSIFNLLFVRL